MNRNLVRMAPAAFLTVLAFPLASATSVRAQPSQTAVPEVTAPVPRHAAAGRNAGRPTDRVEKRITELHDKLKITPAQAPQWDAFAAVMRDNARGMEATYQTRTSDRQTMNAVDNLQSYAVIAEQHAQDLRKLAPAFAGVYNVMTDDQKRNADGVFRSSGADGARRQR